VHPDHGVQMKKTFLTLSVLAAAASLHGAPLHASQLSQAWDQPPTVQAGLSVQAGSAPIEQALSTIIPAPYHIELDRSVPTAAVIVWPAGSDWMMVLRAAVAPLDLYVEPDWQNNTIRVVHLSPGTSSENGLRQMPAASSHVVDPEVVTASTAGAPSNADGFKPLPTLRPGALPLIESRSPGDHPVVSTTTHPLSAPISAVPAADPAGGYVIPAGTMLSAGLSKYVQALGWTMKWNITDDYMLDEPLPIPAGSVIDGVSFVVRTYQSQGGLMGDIPLFAKPNHVVVIQPASVRED
jgi:hypothetical protein